MTCKLCGVKLTSLKSKFCCSTHKAKYYRDNKHKEPSYVTCNLQGCEELYMVCGGRKYCCEEHSRLGAIERKRRESRAVNALNKKPKLAVVEKPKPVEKKLVDCGMSLRQIQEWYVRQHNARIK